VIILLDILPSGDQAGQSYRALQSYDRLVEFGQCLRCPAGQCWNTQGLNAPTGLYEAGLRQQRLDQRGPGCHVMGGVCPAGGTAGPAGQGIPPMASGTYTLTASPGGVRLLSLHRERGPPRGDDWNASASPTGSRGQCAGASPTKWMSQTAGASPTWPGPRVGFAPLAWCVAGPPHPPPPPPVPHAQFEVIVGGPWGRGIGASSPDRYFTGCAHVWA
jgi:hypothetical protein